MSCWDWEGGGWVLRIYDSDGDLNSTLLECVYCRILLLQNHQSRVGRGGGREGETVTLHLKRFPRTVSSVENATKN